MWEPKIRTKFVYYISVQNGDWNNESLCFPSPLPAFFGILRKGKLWAEQMFGEFPSGRPPLPWRLFPLLVSLSHWMIQTSPARRPLHPSHGTRPSLNAWGSILPLSCAPSCAHAPCLPYCTFSLLLSLLFLYWALWLFSHFAIFLDTYWVMLHSMGRTGICLHPDHIPGERGVWNKSNLLPQSIWPVWPMASILEKTYNMVFLPSFLLSPGAECAPQMINLRFPRWNNFLFGPN